MEAFLRQWRQDALDRHQYDSAIFIGDKLLAITQKETDAFWLAQVHFSNGNYTRAQSFLAKHDLVSASPACKYLSAHCFIKQNRFEEALSILGDANPTHLIGQPNRRKRQETLGHTRTHSKSQSSKISSKGKETNDFSDEAKNIKHESAMCYLRGLCYAKQNAFDRAKECYKDAVSIDVQCYEAFEQLMKNCLMSPDEEWQFLDSLDFDSIHTSSASSSQEASEFTKMLYITRLSKYKNPQNFTSATETLSTHYNMANNPDLLLSKASLLFTQCRFKEALAITSSIILSDKYNFSIYPIHLASLYELHQTNALFLIAHDLADAHPSEPCTWLAVGIYYLSTNKISEARRYFSKASMMDPHFGPAWIGFAHTFAAEGEHDQAISAYSTAARLFMGTHLPQLFLGMQNLLLNNMTLAEEFLRTAMELCSSDPLLLNEMGVVAYHQEELDRAIDMFNQALAIADDIGSEPKAWISTRCNLGHAYRRQHRWNEALDQFDDVLRLGGKDTEVFCAKGLVLLELEKQFAAVQCFHEALAISPQDAVATELLNKALEETAAKGIEEMGLESSRMEEEWEREVEERKRQARLRTRGKGRSGKMSKGGVSIREDPLEEDSMIAMELSSDLEDSMA